jgi:hypothetical protein
MPLFSLKSMAHNRIIQSKSINVYAELQSEVHMFSKCIFATPDIIVVEVHLLQMYF